MRFSWKFDITNYFMANHKVRITPQLKIVFILSLKTLTLPLQSKNSFSLASFVPQILIKYVQEY